MSEVGAKGQVVGFNKFAQAEHFLLDQYTLSSLTKPPKPDPLC